MPSLQQYSVLHTYQILQWNCFIHLLISPSLNVGDQTLKQTFIFSLTTIFTPLTTPLSPLNIRPNQLPSSINLLQWNCRSIRAARESLQHIIYQENIHIALISETWLLPNEPFYMSGFQIYRHDRTDGYGGSLILIKNCIPSSHLHINPRPLLSSPNSTVATAQIHLKDKTYKICSVYIPPNTDLHPQHISDLLNPHYSFDFIGGDFNAKSAMWGNTNYDIRGSLIEEAILQSPRYSIINDGSTTYIGSASSWSAIDISICSNRIALLCNWTVLPDTHGSDHLPILIEFHSYQTSIHPDMNPPPPPSHIRYYNTEKVNWDNFRTTSTLSISNIQDIETNPLQGYSQFVSSISDALHKSAPPLSNSPRYPKNKKSPIWWNPQCTEAVRARSRALQTFKQQPNLENYISLRRLNALAKKTFKLARRISWRNFTNSFNKSTPMSKIWSMAKSISNSRSLGPTPNQEQIEQLLTSLAPPYAPQRDEMPPDQYPACSPHLLDQPFTIFELTTALQIKKNSAPGSDSITYTILKKLSTSSLITLCRILNSLWSHSKIPSDWLSFKIIPIPKKGSPKLRPIALASCLRKTLESMLNKRLVYWLESSHILPDNLFGFRPGRNTIEAVTNLVLDIHQAFIEKKHLIATFLDIQSAYDNVHLPSLHEILKRTGIPDHFNTYVISLFLNRSVHVRSSHDHHQRIAYFGLPQGSSLSPTLFNIYSMSLVPDTSGVSSLFFADDIAIYSAHQDLTYAAFRNQCAIQQMSHIANSLNLTFSPNKSSTVVFSLRPFNPANAIVACYNSPIPVNSVTKYLGITLDSKLLWNHHIKSLIANISPSLNLIQMLSSTYWGSDPLILSILYKAVIRSKLDYGSVLYGSSSKTHLHKIERFQNKCTRLILKAFSSTPTTALCAETKIPPLHIRRDYLASRFIIHSLSITTSPIATKISNIIQRWRFTSWRLPLLCSIAPTFLQYQHTALSFPHFKSTLFPSYFCLFDSTPPRLLPKINNQSFSQTFTLFTQENFPNFHHFFTDGSKKEDEVGAAFWNPTLLISRSYSLPAFTSVLHAELSAILLCLDYILHSFPAGKFLIISDSLTAIRSIHKPPLNINNTLAFKIALNLSIMTNRFQIRFLWIPGHSGIPGNHYVDNLARAAHLSSNKFDTLTPVELLSLAKSINYQKWMSSFEKNNKSQYFTIQPTLPSRPWFSRLQNLSRRSISKICRLRFGHSSLPYFLFHIGLSPSNICPLHTNLPMPCDVNHLFFTCPALRNQQLIFWHHFHHLQFPTPTNSNILLSLDSIALFPHIIDFLQSIPPEIII